MSQISEDKGRVLILFLQKLRSSQSDERLKAHHSDISADSGGLYCGDTLCVQAVTVYLGLALAVCGDQGEGTSLVFTGCVCVACLYKERRNLTQPLCKQEFSGMLMQGGTKWQGSNVIQMFSSVYHFTYMTQYVSLLFLLSVGCVICIFFLIHIYIRKSFNCQISL